MARFSQVATWSVGFIALTGVYGAWRGVGSWHALSGTSYGRLVLVKVVAFCGLLALGYLSRRLVARVKAAGAVVREPAAEPAVAGTPRSTSNAWPAPSASVASGSPVATASRRLRRLRRTVTAEACVAAGVLVVRPCSSTPAPAANPCPAAAGHRHRVLQHPGHRRAGHAGRRADPGPPRPQRLRLDLLDPAGHPTPRRS